MKKVQRYSLDLRHQHAVDAVVRSISTPVSEEQMSDLYQHKFGMSFLDHIVLDQSLNYGLPYSFKYEQNGSLVQNIYPIQQLASEQISSSSETELLLHTEVAFHDDRPDALILFCIRADENAGTTYAELHEILKFVPRWALEQLKQPSFAYEPDLSFTKNGAPSIKKIQPVLSEDLSEMTYDFHAITSLTDDGRTALNLFQKAISICTKTIYLRPGDFLVLPNRQTVHGRTQFAPRFDGTDRWLKRVIVRNADRSVLFPDEVNTMEKLGER